MNDAQVKHVIEATDSGENPIWQPLHIGGAEPLDGDTPAAYGQKVLDQWVEDQSALADQEPPTLADEYGNALLRVVVYAADDEYQEEPLATVEAELWSITRVAEEFGYTGPNARGNARRELSRLGVRAAHRQIDNHGRAHSLYDPNQVRAARNARPGRGVRRSQPTTEYGTVNTLIPDAGSVATLGDYTASALGEHAGDYDTDALTDAYRDALNNALDGTGLSLHGDIFYGPYPRREDAADLIAATVGKVDFWGIAAEHENNPA